VERPLQSASVELPKIRDIRLGPRPWFYTYDLEQSPPELDVAVARGATALFSGAGGDGLFLQPLADSAVAEYLHRHSFDARLLRVALNAARITRTSIWSTLRRGLRQHFARSGRAHLVGADEMRALIPAAALEASRNDDSISHQWLTEAGKLPPGLRAHILSISLPPAFYDAFDRAREVERTFVLLSQPLIELCLRIPIYVWISGGVDRSLVRRAFAPDLPAAIIRRTAKGTVNRHARKLVDANESFLRLMLLEGILVQKGLLDRARLAGFLSSSRAHDSRAHFEVLYQHLCTEVWLRRWSAVTTSSGS